MEENIRIFRCNACKGLLSSPAVEPKIPHEVAGSHWSLNFTKQSGFVSGGPSGHFLYRIEPGIYHFCDENCLAKFFARQREPKMRGDK